MLVEVGRDLGRIIQKYTLNDLEKGSTYHFRIRARNCTGWGTLSWVHVFAAHQLTYDRSLPTGTWQVAGALLAKRSVLQ